jgi:sugar phosphate permease
LKLRTLGSPANMVLFLTWLLFAAYYIGRFNFSPIIPLLKTELSFSNAEAGSLMAFFFLSYTIFQLPAGYLGDRFGPRKILTFGALISIAGNLIFSQGTNFIILSIGQLINGMGQAVGWSSAIKMVVNWFPKERRATALGFFITCVIVGSSLGIWLSGLIGDSLGWRVSFLIPPLLMAVAVSVFWFVARDTPVEMGLPGFNDEAVLEQKLAKDSRSKLAVVLTNRTLWVVALVYFCFVYVQFGCLVWIPAFLVENYGMSVNRASMLTSLVLLPGIVASLLGGFLSDRFFHGRRKPLIIVGMAVLSGSCFLLSLGLGIAMALSALAVTGLMLLLPDVLLAAYPADILSRKSTATAMGFLATFTSASGILSTPVSGKILDVFQSYGVLFLSFAVIALLGTIITLFIDEKKRDF